MYKPSSPSVPAPHTDKQSTSPTNPKPTGSPIRPLPRTSDYPCIRIILRRSSTEEERSLGCRPSTRVKAIKNWAATNFKIARRHVGIFINDVPNRPLRPEEKGEDALESDEDLDEFEIEDGWTLYVRDLKTNT
ncbi:hypothetical protein BP5796_00025 [Coleophoma crateriformis]|uniref:Ubiquitin-like domain-containing protein n=1 Tax=Coleophoma crateriformis TaxID=565419 RepID=A0A3D8T6P8_9HELO|nr:hypothetical protein BP5796_00025 [Coleophoma crateriformis]